MDSADHDEGGRSKTAPLYGFSTDSQQGQIRSRDRLKMALQAARWQAGALARLDFLPKVNHSGIMPDQLKPLLGVKLACAGVFLGHAKMVARDPAVSEFFLE